tara:strand:- start:186 stop:1247 length:1062 start_codon:yes stop_codon:yes gene_type:complete
MDKFRQFAAQQEQIQANKPPASREMQYLAANPDVMQNAKEELAKASQDNERLRTNPIGATSFIENVARQHYLNFGKQEGREGFGIIDPRMKSFASIMANTYDMDDPGTDGELRPEFVGPLGDMQKFVSTISPPLYDRLIDRFYGDTNEDKLPGRVDDVIGYMFKRNNDGVNAFEVSGGQEALFEAYDQMGITGQGESYADKQARDLLELAKKYSIETLSPDINMDGTGGSEEISLGGPTGTGYDSVGQLIADIPNWSNQLAVVPTINPIGLLNTFRAMYTGDINKNPYDTSDQTGTRIDRSVPSPMEFNAPTQEQLFQQMDKLQFNSPGYPGLTSGNDDDGPFGGFGSGGGGE